MLMYVIWRHTSVFLFRQHSRHNTDNKDNKADCFSEPPQNLSLFPIISFLTVFGFLFCTPCT